MIVGEISCNHLGHFARAVELIDAAKYAGADAVKFQTWTPDSMAFEGNKIESGAWTGRDMQELYAEAHTPWDWHKPLFEHARKLGLVPFSTPFDIGALEFLETLDCPIYKISSFEIVDLELIRACAKTGKSLIISTGMASRMEILLAVKAAEGAASTTLLKCTSAYPARPESCNLSTLMDLKRICPSVGISDHTQGIAVPVAATMMGIDVIEKHLTLSRKEGLDAQFSLEPHEFKQMVDACRIAKQAIGTIQYGPTPDELPSYQLRRSLYLKKDVVQGQRITKQDITTARPGLGAKPCLLPILLNRTMLKQAKAGTPLTEDMLLEV